MITLSPNPSAAELAQAVRLLTQAVESLSSNNVDNVAGWAGGTSNVTQTRTLDANTATASDVADVLGTLIDDLLAKGVLK